MDRTAQISGLTSPNSFLALALALCFCSFSFHLIWSPRFFFSPYLTFDYQLYLHLPHKSNPLTITMRIPQGDFDVVHMYLTQIWWMKHVLCVPFPEAVNYFDHVPPKISTTADMLKLIHTVSPTSIQHPLMWFLLGPPRVSVWFGSLKMQRFTRK